MVFGLHTPLRATTSFYKPKPLQAFTTYLSTLDLRIIYIVLEFLEWVSSSRPQQQPSHAALVSDWRWFWPAGSDAHHGSYYYHPLSATVTLHHARTHTLNQQLKTPSYHSLSLCPYAARILAVGVHMIVCMCEITCSRGECYISLGEQAMKISHAPFTRNQ